MTHDDEKRRRLDALMYPASVAIIGASDDPGKIGGRPVHYLKSRSFDGEILPVNPRRDQIQGLPCYPSIDALPGSVDLAIVALPAHLVVDSVRALASKGCRGAVVFSAGFAEIDADGAERQRELAAIAEAADMRIVGPNCLGIFNANNALFATFSTSLEQNTPSGGAVAIASQSGAYASHLSMLATARRMAIGYWFTTGNECDVEVAECIHWLSDRDDVKVIIAYAEGVRNGHALRTALANAKRRGVAVVFVKVGRSTVGARAAESHTAALTGSDAVFDCLCRQFGAHRAHNTEEALDVAQALAAGRLPASRRTGLMTVSGGVGIHMADCAEELDLDVAPMPESGQRRLTKILPYAGTANPVDVTAQVINEVNLFDEFLAVTVDEGKYDITIIYFTFVAAVERMIEPMTNALKKVLDRHPNRLVILSIIAPDDVVERYEATGCVVIQDPWRAVRAAAALARFAESFSAAPMPQVSIDSNALQAPHGQEHETKLLLARHDFPVSKEELIASPTEAQAAGERIGWPVVIKIISPDIAHKTEAGAVAVRVERDDAETTCRTLLDTVRRRQPDARIDGLLIAEYVGDGVEVIIGVEHDETFGPVTMFGLGGIMVEVMEDVAFALAPFDENEAQRLIDTTRAGKILAGHRGAPAADRQALARLLVAVSEFADRHRGHIQSMDLNPVMVRPQGQGATILDALLVARRPDDND